MKIAVTSDWHGYLLPYEMIPDCDLMVIAGDIGLGETFSYDPEVLLTDWFAFLESLPFPVIAVAGNHDFENQVKVMRHMPWTYLEDEVVEIDGIKIWGSPWSNPFAHGWAFNMTEEDQAELFTKIPDDVHVIISHGPPFGCRDTVSRFDGEEWSKEASGSKALRQRMNELPNLQLVACGHIHTMYGKQPWVTDRVFMGNIVNGSLVNNNYEIQNKPIVVEVEEEV